MRENNLLDRVTRSKADSQPPDRPSVAHAVFLGFGVPLLCAKLVVVEDPAAVAALTDAIRVSTVSRLQEEVHRFTGCSKLLGRFADLCAAWEAGSLPNARQITDSVNELRIALRLIQDAKCNRLEYEPRLDGTDKTIDFMLTNTEGKRIFYDVKTLLPEEGDGWALYQKAKANGWFTPGTNLDLDEEFGGPELAHYAFATRDKFIHYSLELEQKVRCVAKDGETYFRMVFCGDNFRCTKATLRTSRTPTSGGQRHGTISRRCRST